jgi:hypothetical protein
MSAVGVVLHSLGRASSLYSLIVTAVFSVGWWVADGFYIQCDWVNGFDVGGAQGSK